MIPLLLLLLLVTVADAFPSGPPSAACLNQQPFHPVPPSMFAVYPAVSGSPKFAINVNSATWTAGGSLTVTLVVTDSSIKGFGGFILKATRASNGYTNDNLGPLLGNFDCTTSVGTGAPCRYNSVYAPAGEKNCVSHSVADANMYRNVTCQWTAPATNEGPIMFSATVVMVFNQYQTQIQSAVLPNAAGAPGFNRTDETLTDRITPFGCGKTKSCVLYPPTCEVRGGCRSGVMVTPQTTGQLLFEVFGDTFDWLAVGLGDGAEMKNLELFTCVYDPKQNKVVLGYGFAPAMSFIPLHRSDITMIKTRIDRGNGNTMSLPIQPNAIYCQFMRPIDAAFSYYSYNASTLANPVVTVSSKMSGEGKYIILAQGQNIQNTPNLGKHTHLPLRSSRKLSATGSPTTLYFAGLEAKVQTHATLMTIFWLFLCGFGIIVARHTRPVLTHKVFKKQIWFLMHACFMVLGYMLAIAGVIYILIKDGGWETDSQVHGILGLIGMGLGLLNILAGILRPHPGARFRPIFNRLHRWNGLLAYLFASVAIWLGATLECHRPEFRFWVVIVLGIWTGLQIIFMIGFECARLKVVRNKRLEHAIDRRFQLTDLKASASAQSVTGDPDVQSTQPLENEEPKIKGKQLVHINGVWIAVYGCTFLALAAAFWAGVWIY